MNEEAIKKPEDINLLDPEVQECPYRAYEVLREQAPVYQDPNTGFYVVTRYDDLREVLRNYDLYTRDISGTFDKTVETERAGYWQNADAVREVFREGGWPSIDSFGREPPTHATLRKYIDPSFTAGRIRKMEPAIREIINELIDSFIDDGEVEFIGQFCVPLPMHVIADRLGLPKEDLPKLKAWSQDQVDAMSQRLSMEEEVACAKRLVEFQHYLAEKFEEKRQNPGEDIISDLVNGRDEDGEGLDMVDLLGTTFALNIGGNETTTNSIAGGMLMLMEQPEVMAELREDPSLLKNFIEEIIRLETPVQSLFRIARKDSELGGVTIPKNAIIDMRFGAANRDPEEFENPDRLDLHRRNPGKHLAYGTAHHHCIGAPLARQEMKLAFEIILERMSNIQLVPGKNDFLHHPHFALRGLKHLWLSFDKVK
ncbi:MAG: cytochrome P450 [Alphaproteobacteria bacterium]|nr:cytochrome P450 [Alphaproteobacteria bacterium]